MSCFELGPIRPPSEAASILLRLTRNCPWNRCAFCPVYKGQRFSPRTVDEVRHDIDSIAAIAGLLSRRIDERFGGSADPSAVIQAVQDAVAESDAPERCVRQVAFWMYHGMRSLFLQDADSLVLKTDRVVAILDYIREKFPQIERVTTYARARTISNKTAAEMATLRDAGLDRVHIGMESGSDAVLALVDKGVTQEEQIRAGRLVREAGMELSLYYMPGLGGRALMEENARESAAVVNAVNPHFVRIRSVIPVPGTPLFDLMQEGRWTSPGEEEKVAEIRRFIELLDGVTAVVASDHIMNLLEDVEGTLPADRDRMLAAIDRFAALPTDTRESFIVGRRMGRYRSLDDFRIIPDVEQMKGTMKAHYPSLDAAVLEVLWNYI